MCNICLKMKCPIFRNILYINIITGIEKFRKTSTSLLIDPVDYTLIVSLIILTKFKTVAYPPYSTHTRARLFFLFKYVAYTPTKIEFKSTKVDYCVLL